MSWWLEKRFRMVQNNLRDIDGAMDVDCEIEKLKELGANVVQVGCGGISAFTPTELESQRPTPYLQGDKFGELLEKCHRNGIRVIARFDVSKVHMDYLDKHPEWFSRSQEGKPILFNDTAATCINAPYQQELSLQIVGEVVRKYPVDGIFFNMFGYQTRDYDGNYVGICQCESCKKRFRAYSGMELPTKEDVDSPVFQKYLEFKTFTVADILHKIRDTVKAVNPEIAVSTYSDDGIDIIRCESNSAVDRPLPFWLYSASDNTASIHGTFANKVASNCAINAVDIPYRFMGVSPYLNETRMCQNMANGSNLDWCIIGAFPDYPDRLNFEGVKWVFHFHARYEDMFSSLRSAAKVLLFEPDLTFGFNRSNEYRGIFKMLKEKHIPFDVAIAPRAKAVISKLNRYDWIILPGMRRIPDPDFREALVKTTATVIGTGCTFAEDSELVAELFGVRLEDEIKPVRGSYLLTQPKEVFTSFPQRDWVYLDKESRHMELLDAKGYLPLVNAAWYAPPERAFGHTVGKDMAAVKGNKNIYLPWKVGTLYFEHGYEDFKDILMDLAKAVHPLELPFETDAPNCAEVFWNRCGEKEYLLQIINLSGFDGVVIGKPLPLREMNVTFHGKAPVKIEKLTGEGPQRVEAGATLTVDCPGIYRAYRLQF